jgi:hypothetical protein
VTCESLALALEIYSAGMRQRLATQKKNLTALLGSISHNVNDVRAMMRKLKNLSFEGGMQAVEKTASRKKKPVRKKKPIRKTKAVGKTKTAGKTKMIRKTKAAISLAGKNKPKAEKTKIARKPVRSEAKASMAKTKRRPEKSFFGTQKPGTIRRAVRGGLIDIVPSGKSSKRSKGRQTK